MPLGVLAGVRLPVVAGGVALMAALGALTRDLRRADARRPASGGRRGWFVAVMAFLALSVLVGNGLARNLPWT